MAWDYNPGTGPSLRHPAGEHPVRPLTVGDEVIWESGVVGVIVGTTERLLLIEGRWRHQPMFRLPIEGDYSEVMT